MWSNITFVPLRTLFSLRSYMTLRYTKSECSGTSCTTHCYCCF
nr:MAG TPA: hypothetical protein [Bacteriophage sp.]